DHAPLRAGQRALHLEAADVARAGDDEGLDGRCHRRRVSPITDWLPRYCCEQKCESLSFASMRVLQLLAAALLGLSFSAWAVPSAAPTAVHLLDYIGVDYAEAVADGKVINALEYGEMTEFADEVRRLLDELPPTPELPRLRAD